MREIVKIVLFMVMIESGYADFGANFRMDVVDTSFGYVDQSRSYFPEDIAYLEADPTTGATSGGILNLADAERDRLAAVGAAKEGAMRQSEAAAERERQDATPVKDHFANNWGKYTTAGLAAIAVVVGKNTDWYGLAKDKDDDGDSKDSPDNVTVDLSGATFSGEVVNVNIEVNVESKNTDTVE